MCSRDVPDVKHNKEPPSLVPAAGKARKAVKSRLMIAADSWAACFPSILPQVAPLEQLDARDLGQLAACCLEDFMPQWLGQAEALLEREWP